MLAWPTPLSGLYRTESRCSGPGFELLLAFPRSPVPLKEVWRLSSGPGDCHVIINNLAQMRVKGREWFCGLTDLGERPTFPVAKDLG